MARSSDILSKIAEAGLVGRGGASYPVAKKWQAVKTALTQHEKGYIILNGAEGEPGVKKDGFIMGHFPEEVIDGLSQADKYLGSSKIKRVIIFLNRNYHKAYAPDLRRILEKKKYQLLQSKVDFFVKPEALTYVSGEESALLSLIEGRKVEPRLRPPYPTEKGLYGRPTLINNTETFYDVSLAVAGRYEERRFYTVTGAVSRPGVYALPASFSIEDVLRESGNWPQRPFFVQVGGEASGEVLNSKQLAAPVEGAGSIMVYDLEKTDKHKLIERWLNFYAQESCGRCAICREGTFRLREAYGKKPRDQKLFRDIVSSLEETSFCSLGASLATPLKSLFENIIRSN